MKNSKHGDVYRVIFYYDGNGGRMYKAQKKTWLGWSTLTKASYLGSAKESIERDILVRRKNSLGKKVIGMYEESDDPKNCMKTIYESND